jgi:hypothetical protein
MVASLSMNTHVTSWTGCNTCVPSAFGRKGSLSKLSNYGVRNHLSGAVSAHHLMVPGMCEGKECNVTQTIDVTGLSPEAIRTVESLVGLLRASHRQSAAGSPSIFDLFGKAEVLRTGQDIAEQLRVEREAWGET